MWSQKQSGFFGPPCICSYSCIIPYCCLQLVRFFVWSFVHLSVTKIVNMNEPIWCSLTSKWSLEQGMKSSTVGLRWSEVIHIRRLLDPVGSNRFFLHLTYLQYMKGTISTNEFPVDFKNKPVFLESYWDCFSVCQSVCLWCAWVVSKQFFGKIYTHNLI